LYIHVLYIRSVEYKIQDYSLLLLQEYELDQEFL
jgi:hypothetical protein